MKGSYGIKKLYGGARREYGGEGRICPTFSVRVFAIVRYLLLWLAVTCLGFEFNPTLLDKFILHLHYFVLHPIICQNTKNTLFKLYHPKYTFFFLYLYYSKYNFYILDYIIQNVYFYFGLYNLKYILYFKKKICILDYIICRFYNLK